MFGSWRLAARMARREARHRPARALLVVLLIAVPVFAITVLDVLARAGIDSQLARYQRAHGATDVALLVDPDRPAAAAVLQRIPDGSRVVRYRNATLPLTPVAASRGTRSVDVTDGRLPAPDGAGGIELVAGRAAQPGEVVISPSVAEWLHLDLGDRLQLSRPAFTARVVGIGRSRHDFQQALIDAPAFPFSAVKVPGVVLDAYTIRYPAGTNATAIAADKWWNVPGVVGVEIARPRGVTDGRGIEDGTVFFWSWVGAALILAMVGVIIAAAFATTARRQLVMLGQLSANGADPGFLRRALTLQGTITGLIGTIVGMGGAAIGLAIARDFIVTLMRHDPGAFDFSVRDLAVLGATAVVTATVAARVPTRHVVRVPVLSALAGRRPLAPVPPLRWLKAVAIFGAGVGILALVALNIRDRRIGQPGLVAMIAILGGLLVLAGAAFLTPVAVTLAARAGRFTGAAARIALRGLAQVRSRSAAVVTAIAIAGALAVAGSTAMLGLAVDRNPSARVLLPPNAILIGSVRGFGSEASGGDVAGDVAGDVTLGVSAVKRAVPGTKVRRIFGLAVGRDGAPLGIEAPWSDAVATVIVADATLVRSIRLPPEDRLRLRSGAAVSLHAGVPRSLTIETAVGRATLSPLPVSGFTYGPYQLGVRPVLIDPAHARRIGVPTGVVGAMGIAPHALSGDQRSRLWSGMVDVYAPNAAASSDAESPFVIEVGESSADRAGFGNPATVRRWSIAAMIAFAFLVSVTALLLGAAESRDETAVLAALGAAPEVERRIGAVRSWVLAGVGALIAVPVGVIPIAVVFRAVQQPFAGDTDSGLFPHVVFPWITVVGIVIAIPLVVATGAWIARGVAQRAQAFRGTLAFEAD